MTDFERESLRLFERNRKLMVIKMTESKLNWGIDGYGRASICSYDSPVILFCGLPCVPGRLAVDYYLELNDE